MRSHTWSIAVLSLATVASVSPAQSRCFDGTTGTAGRVRRALLEISELRRGAPLVLHLGTRPPRTIAMQVDSVSGPKLVASATDTSGARLVAHLASDRPESARAVLWRGADSSDLSLRPASGTGDHAWAVGHWHGTASFGGVPLRLGVTVERGPCDLLVGWIDSPDQGQARLPLTEARATGDTLLVRLAYLDLTLTIVRRDTEPYDAVVAQRGEPVSFSVRRGARVTEHRRPQEPRPPFPYVSREVRFAHRAAGLAFAGTLTLPAGPGPHPALLLLSGSGAQDRDQTVAGHRTFLVLADFLTRRGYAVLRVDDRGAGQSTGNMLASGIEDLAGDARAALEFLRVQPGIDPTRLGLVGHSEGAYIAPLVASRDSSVRSLVLLGAPAVRGRDVFLAQRAAIARAEGLSAIQLAVDSMFVATSFAALDAGGSDATLEHRLDVAIRDWLTTLSADQRRVADVMLGERTAARDSMSLALWRSTWFRSIYAYDPRPILESLEVPALAVYGSLDLQVPPAQNVPALEAARRGRPGALTVVTLPGINHLLQRASTGLLSEYVTIEETIAPLVLEVIGDWLARTSHP